MRSDREADEVGRDEEADGIPGHGSSDQERPARAPGTREAVAMGLRKPGRAASLAFLTAFVTLFVQILVHRMVAAKLVNNFAWSSR